MCMPSRPAAPGSYAAALRSSSATTLFKGREFLLVNQNLGFNAVRQ
jgi:hypothetical protein